MPLFRKQSTKAKKRLQHQQYLAKESPDKTYDISESEISDIPQGLFSICKVLQKEVLVAHTNWLTSLKGGGDLRDLHTIRVLDLHNNELSSLPDDLSPLVSLQVLLLDNNRLRHLPDSLGMLGNLQTLGVRANKLHELPDSVKDLRSLRSLDISQNHIHRLPPALCHVRTLETVVVDTDKMEHPAPEVCHEGTEAMMKVMCSENGMEYEPPSKFLLDVLDGPNSPPASPSYDTLKADMDAFNGHEDTIKQYEQAKSARQHEVLLLEKQMEEQNRLQAQYALEAAQNKRHLVEYVAQDQERMMEELSTIQQSRDRERKRLVKTLYDVEQNAAALIERLLEISEEAKKNEDLMDQMEQERQDAEEWFKVRQEEVDRLRRQEVLDAMARSLAENEAMQRLVDNYLESKDAAQRNAQIKLTETSDLVENVLTCKQMEQQDLVATLLREEQTHREAFEVLLRQQDTRHTRITGQISLIHSELAQLTAAELHQRDAREEAQKDILEQKRQALTELLRQLMVERDTREGELRRRLLEMEEQREANQTEYWMVQYQRLMDRKPQVLIDQEKKLEFAVVSILEAAGASDYISTFSRHRITIETLCQVTDDDLVQMGMQELGLRRSVLREVHNYRQRLDDENSAAAKAKGLATQDDLLKPPSPDSLTPSAPNKSPVTPTSPPLEVTARGLNSECVVCLDKTSTLLFLYCGHVCTCQPCGAPLVECPMCRGEILQRVVLSELRPLTSC